MTVPAPSIGAGAATWDVEKPSIAALSNAEAASPLRRPSPPVTDGAASTRPTVLSCAPEPSYIEVTATKDPQNYLIPRCSP